VLGGPCEVRRAERSRRGERSMVEVVEREEPTGGAARLLKCRRGRPWRCGQGRSGAVVVGGGDKGERV
jgi:hypothetical protein